MLPPPGRNPAPSLTSSGYNYLPFPLLLFHLSPGVVVNELGRERHTWLVFLSPCRQMTKRVVLEKNPPLFYTFVELIFTYFLILDPPSVCSPPEIFTRTQTITDPPEDGYRSTTRWDRRLVSLQFSMLASVVVQEA